VTLLPIGEPLEAFRLEVVPGPQHRTSAPSFSELSSLFSFQNFFFAILYEGQQCYSHGPACEHLPFFILRELVTAVLSLSLKVPVTLSLVGDVGGTSKLFCCLCGLAAEDNRRE
jgi:hypothetical protein